MDIDYLSVTSQGLQCLSDVVSGAPRVRPTIALFGTNAVAQPQTPSALTGQQVASGRLAYVECFGQCSRLVYEIPAGVPADGYIDIQEVILQLDDGTPFAYTRLSSSIIKYSDNIHRIDFFLYLDADSSAVIDVVCGSYSSLPQVSTANLLPTSGSSADNSIIVADGQVGGTPFIAVRNGLGGQGWSFCGLSMLHHSQLGASFVSALQIQHVLDVANGTPLLVAVTSGGGAGHVRTAVYTDGNIMLTTEYPEIPLLTAESVVAIWCAPNPSNTGVPLTWPSNSADVPNDWVLARGADNEPVWVPPRTGSGATAQGVTLYTAPSRLVSKSLVATAVPSTLRYELPDSVESSADVMLTCGGVWQTRMAFCANDEFLDLSGNVPEQMALNARAWVREPSQGHALDIECVTVVGDGATYEYELGHEVNSVEDLIVVIKRILNSVAAYTVSGSKIRFTQPLPSGYTADIYVLTTSESTGSSTQCIQVEFLCDQAQQEFRLPLSPAKKSMVLCSESGTLMMQSEFRLVNDILYPTSVIPKGRRIEVWIFNNVSAGGRPDRSLTGVVTRGSPTPQGIRLYRHGCTPLDIPMPRPVFTASNGIEVDQTQYPLVKLSYDPAKDPAAAKRSQCLNLFAAENDLSEIVLTHRLQFTEDCTITVDADFECVLGAGFSSESNREYIEAFVTIIEAGTEAPKYGTSARGAGTAGFSQYMVSDTEAIARSSRHNMNSADLIVANHPKSAVDVVAKMRVRNADVAAYGSSLQVALRILVTR